MAASILMSDSSIFELLEDRKRMIEKLKGSAPHPASSRPAPSLSSRSVAAPKLEDACRELAKKLGRRR